MDTTNEEPLGKVTAAPEAAAPEASSENEEDEDHVIASEADFQGNELSEMGSWIVRTLHQSQPGAEITLGSVKALTEMLDSITSRVLDEAKKVNDGTGPSSATAAGVASSHNNQALTSLDIHKAIKRLLPGEPGDPLRPYLPTVTKHAWHLDKQSLKGIKKQKVTANQQQQENLLLQEATAELVDQLVENEAPSTATANV